MLNKSVELVQINKVGCGGECFCTYLHELGLTGGDELPDLLGRHPGLELPLELEAGHSTIGSWPGRRRTCNNQLWCMVRGIVDYGLLMML